MRLMALTALFHLPFAVAVVGATWKAGASIAALCAMSAVVVSTALLSGRFDLIAADRPISRWRMWLVEEVYFVHWGAVMFSAPAFLILVALAALTGFHLQSPHPWGLVAQLAYAVGFALSLWAVVFRRRMTRVRSLDVPVKGLPPAFHGYRIAHLSDLHVGSSCPKTRAMRWVRRTNALDVDLVALTGDYVTSGVHFHQDVAAVMIALRARDGVFAVMGNHDYYDEGEPLLSLLKEGGIGVLRNDVHRLSRDGDTLAIVGVDDVYTQRADVSAAVESLGGEEVALGLAHDPDLFDQLAEHGIRLVLSGHTHWGQVGVPFVTRTLNLAAVRNQYHAGVVKKSGATLIISPGLGTTGPPLRLGAAPEIFVLRLLCEN